MKPYILVVALAAASCARSGSVTVPTTPAELTSAEVPAARDATELYLDPAAAELCGMTDAPSFSVRSGDDEATARLARCMSSTTASRATVVLIGRGNGPSTTADVDLGLKRALDLKALLVARGVPEERILATSSPEASGEGRRVDLAVAFPP